MKVEHPQLAAALDAIAEHISAGSGRAEDYAYTDDEYALGSAEWNLELAYTELLIVAEALGLPGLRADIASTLADARKEGIAELARNPEGDLYAKWSGPARRFSRALQGIYSTDPLRTVSKDVESILREATYSINNRTVFSDVPRDERTVHDRVEAVLRCVFPSLQRKPRLGKPIKNFEPDTGLPSIQTLVEYKFVSDAKQVPAIADEILADTRGYSSKEWTTFIYAIYETERFRSEAEWNQLLRACAVSENARVVVMSGQSGVKKGAGSGRKTTSGKAPHK